MMRIYLFLILLIIPALAAARVEVRFEREIEVSKRQQYDLSDLADVDGADAAVMKRLREIVWTSGDDLKSVVRDWKLLEEQENGTVFVIPSKIKIIEASGYSKVEFRRKLANRLRTLCQDCRYEIESVQDSTVRFSDSDWRLDESSVRPSGSMLVSVSTARETAWIPVRLKVFRKAVVAKRMVPLGQILQPEDIEVVEADVSHVREEPVRISDLVGVEAAQSLRAGQVIFPSLLKRMELVRRGQLIKLISGGDGFEVAISAIAEQAGRRGEIIKVKNLETGKMLMGQVVESGEVRLQ